MDDGLKEKVYKKTAQMFDHLGRDYVVTGSFERMSSGGYAGTLHGHSGVGDFHTHVEDPNLFTVISNLKKKVHAQLGAQKSREKSARHESLAAVSPIKLQTKPVPHVLIIDDDLEAIVPIEMIFRDMGCKTSFAIERDEAARKLKEIGADIIVLDWMLDRTTGGELIKMIAEEAQEYLSDHGAKPKVITYSGLEDHQIHFPLNPAFEHVKHWVKPINYGVIANEARSILWGIGF